jgi:hypothetical protein
MTMPDERTRALIWAGNFLIDLALDPDLPYAVRRRAVVIARHFPTLEDVRGIAGLCDQSNGLGPTVAYPDQAEEWLKSSTHGPLRHATRLPWPDEMATHESGQDGQS